MKIIAGEKTWRDYQRDKEMEPTVSELFVVAMTLCAALYWVCFWIFNA